MDMKRYLRIKQPLTTKDIKYAEDRLSIKDVPGIVVPMDIFALISHTLVSDGHESNREALYSAGTAEGKQITENLLGDTMMPVSLSNLDLLLRQISISGYGQASIIKFDPHNMRGLIRVQNSSMATQHRKLLSLSKEPVDFFLAGMISGVLESFYGRKFKVKEKSCTVQGKQDCIFEASPGD